MPDSPLPSNLVSEWRTFLSKERTIDDLFAHGLLFPLQRRREADKMLRMASDVAPRVIGVVGSDKAADVWMFLKSCPTIERVFAIEIRGVPWVNEFRKAFPAVDFLAIGESSFDMPTVVKVARWLGSDNIDVLFLDGHKGMFHADYAAYTLMMGDGGLVLMHDINPVHGDEGPVKFFESLQGSGVACDKIVDTSEADAELALAQDGHPPKTAYADWIRYWRHGSCGVGVVRL